MPTPDEILGSSKTIREELGEKHRELRRGRHQHWGHRFQSATTI